MPLVIQMLSCALSLIRASRSPVRRESFKALSPAGILARSSQQKGLHIKILHQMISATDMNTHLVEQNASRDDEEAGRRPLALTVVAILKLILKASQESSLDQAKMGRGSSSHQR